MNRYFVDKRVGCMAVRDREQIDPEYSGLLPDTKGVIQFWSGYQVYKTCPLCKHRSFSHWNIKDENYVEANELCKTLNLKKNNHD